MGRPGIDYLDVAQAASAIQAKGDNPTIDSVRAWLGSGSKGTIAPLLKQWRHEQAPFLKNQETSLPPDLLCVTHGLWEGLKAKSEQLINDEKDRHSRQLERTEANNRDLTQRLQSSEQKNKILLEDFTALQQQHRSLCDENQALKQRVEFLMGKNGELQQRTEDHASTISQLNEQAKFSYESLEHFRNSVQQQREQDRLEWEKQRSHWLQQEQASQQNISQLSMENHMLSEQLDQALRDKNVLIQEKQTLEQKVAQTQVEYLKAKEEYEHLLVSNSNLANERDELAGKLTQSTNELNRVEQQKHEVQTQLSQYDTLNQTLQTIKNQLETQSII